MNITTVNFAAGSRYATAETNLWQWDYGQILRIQGLDLPDAYAVHFSNEPALGTSSTEIGGPDGVQIPDAYLQTGKPVYAFVFLHTGEDDGETEYKITIYVNARPQPDRETPTPEQQSVIDQLIAALTAGVAKAEDAAAQAEEAIGYMPKIVDGTWWVYDAEAETWTDTGIQAEGQDGVGISGAVLNADYTLTLTFTDGSSYTTPSIRGAQGERGPIGPTPDISIGTVTTGAAGSQAEATMTGTPERPVLNLTIPRGDPGEVTQAEFDDLSDEVDQQKSAFDQSNSRQLAINSGKNKLDLNDYKTGVVNGITFEPHFTNGFLDYINVNGTATGRAEFDTVIGSALEIGNYIVSSFVDENGNVVSYTGIARTEYFNASIGVDVIINDSTEKALTISTSGKLTMRIRVESGSSPSNVKIYPMVRASNISEKKYVPFGYVDTMANIVDSLHDLEASTALMGNEIDNIDEQIALRPDTRNKINLNGATTQTISGITFTPHKTNGFLDYINVNGTANAQADYDIVSHAVLPAGDYIAGAFVNSNGEQITFTGINRVEYYGTNFNYILNSSYPERAVTAQADVTITCRIRVTSGTTVSNVKIYPMIRASVDNEDNYVPYGYVNTIQGAFDKTNDKINKIIESGATSIAYNAEPKAPYWIFHLDCGRKYISIANIKTMLDAMGSAGMNQLQLHFSDDHGFRLGLNDMTFEDEDGTSYDLSSCLGGTENSSKWYSQSDLDDIISYANGKGIAVVPSVDMPGHMGWILNNFPQFKYGSTNSLDISNTTAVKFCKAIVNKYTRFFFSRNCKIWNFGFDEFAGGEGLDIYYNNNEFDKVTAFANGIIDVIKQNGMTPRMYRDAIYYQNDYQYYINKNIEVCYWGIQYQTQPTPDKIMQMGYSCINMSSHYYWVLGSPSYHVNVTPEYLRAVQNLLTDFVIESSLTGYGAVLSIWCDLATSVDVGDNGNSIVTAAVPLISAFGDAITNTMNNI